MIELLTIATHLADSLHYLRGVRFDVTAVSDNVDYQKALELGQKAHEQLLTVIDEMDKQSPVFKDGKEFVDWCSEERADDNK